MEYLGEKRLPKSAKIVPPLDWDSSSRSVESSGRSSTSSGGYSSDSSAPTTPDGTKVVDLSLDEDDKAALLNDDSIVIAPIDNAQDPDTMDIPAWKIMTTRFYWVTILAPMISGMWLSYIQYQSLTKHGASTLSPFRLKLQWLQMLSIVFGTLNAGNVLKICATFSKWRPRLKILGPNVPRIDVLVPVCNEKLDIIQNTVKATLSLDYPSDRFRVIVTDDGASPKLAAWVNELAQVAPNVFYTAREKTGYAGFKAGNINHAIRFIETLPGGPADYIASLDADMIPEPKWLRVGVAHIVKDPQVGMVCPTQQFYNTPNHDPLYQECNGMWRLLDSLKDSVDYGLNYGSGWVVRRDAVRDIGGFPTNCLVEDIYSSAMMLANGWKTVYVNEALQYGLVPETWMAHVKQFTRWYAGDCEHFSLMGFYLQKSKTKTLPLHINVIGFLESVVLHIAKPYFSILPTVLLPLALVSGVDAMFWGPEPWDIKLLLRLSAACELLGWAHKLHQSFITGYSVIIRSTFADAALAPYYTMTHLRSWVLPTWMGGSPTVFTPTGSLRTAVHERSAIHRAPLSARLRHIILDCGAWMHVTTLIVVLAAVGIRVSMEANKANGQVAALGLGLLRCLGWPGSPWLMTIGAQMVPLSYAIWPPNVPEREELLGKKQGKFGPRYPTTRARKCGSNIEGTVWSRFVYFGWYNLYMAYVFGLFVWTFFW